MGHLPLTENKLFGDSTYAALLILNFSYRGSSSLSKQPTTSDEQNRIQNG